MLALAGLGVVQSGTPTAADVRLPPVAIQAADAGAAPLAYLLARAGITAGIVTRQNPSDFTFLRGAAGLDAPATVPLADVLARFTEKHSEYRAVWRDRVLSLAPDGQTCTAAVRMTMVGPMDFTGDASRVVVFLTWLVRGRQVRRAASPAASSAASQISDSRWREITFTLPEPVSMETALNRVVQMVKGGVWFAWEHTRTDGRVGCRSVVYWPNGLVSAPEEDFFIAGAPR